MGETVVRPESWVLLVVAAYIFLAPNVDFAPRLTWHDGQRIAQLTLMGAVVILILAAPVARNAVLELWETLPTGCRVTLFIAFALGIVSGTQALLWRWALLEWGMTLLLLVVALGVAAGRRACGASLDELLIAVIFAMATAYSAKTVVVYLAMLTVGASYSQGFNVRELFTGFSNIRFFGHVQTMLLPFLFLPAMWWTRKPWHRLLLGIVPALWWMLMVASGTRGTWAAVGVGLLVVLAFGGRTGRHWIKWQLVGLVSGLLCYALFVLIIPNLHDQPASFLHRTEDMISLSHREDIWTAALGFSRENPLLGIGPMHFSHHANVIAAHPHNAILQFMAEWGIPAALLFAAMFAAGGLVFAGWVRRNVAAWSPQSGTTAIALLAAIAGAAAQVMVDGILVMPVSQISLTLICGWAMGLYFAGRSCALRCGILEKRLCAVMVLMAAGGIVYGVQPEIFQLEKREAAYLATHPPGTELLPRFWAQGWID